jgi:hypothetical protein
MPRQKLAAAKTSIERHDKMKDLQKPGGRNPQGAICSLQPTSKRRQQHQLPTKTEDEQSRYPGPKNLTRAGNTAAETKREQTAWETDSC